MQKDRIFAITLLLFFSFSASLFALQLTKIQKPPEYVRQDELLTLASDVGTIKVNCFDFPGVFLSAYFVHRLVQTHEKILLKRDLFVCDFDYSRLNRTTVVANSTIWFMNPDAGDLTEEIMHLNMTGEQIVFPMVQPGNYMFEIWILRSHSDLGWEENFFSDLKFYVYESPDAYFSAIQTYQFTLLTSLLSFLGTVTALVLAVVGVRQGGAPQINGGKTVVNATRELGSNKLRSASRIGLAGVLLIIIAFLSGVIVVQQIATQKPESTSLGLAEGALIAVFASAVGAIVQFILAQSEDQRHSKELRRQKREKAYAKLYAILERLDVKASTTRIVTNEGNFKELQAAVEDHYEVLDPSTIKAWRQKKTSHVLTLGYIEYTIEEAGVFFSNVRQHYKRMDPLNPLYSRRDEDIESGSGKPTIPR